MKQFLIRVIEFYQIFLSFDRGLLRILVPGGVCRYEVSCSEYAKQSINKHGITKGVVMGLKRIWSCR